MSVLAQLNDAWRQTWTYTSPHLLPKQHQLTVADFKYLTNPRHDTGSGPTFGCTPLPKTNFDNSCWMDTTYKLLLFWHALLPQCRLNLDETLLADVNDLTKTCVAVYKRSLTHMANIKASAPSHLSQDEIAYGCLCAGKHFFWQSLKRIPYRPDFDSLQNLPYSSSGMNSWELLSALTPFYNILSSTYLTYEQACPFCNYTHSARTRHGIFFPPASGFHMRLENKEQVYNNIQFTHLFLLKYKN